MEETEDIGLGNQLFRIIKTTKIALFWQGELAQLSHSAYENMVQTITNSEKDLFTINLPVGYSASKIPMQGTQDYNKKDLIDRYAVLTHTQLPINEIYHLITIIEAMMSDSIRVIVRQYPEKIGAKKQFSLKDALEASSIEEIHIKAADILINELSYKSPKDFAVDAGEILSVRLLECPAFHRYIEAKATRDVYIHNQGVANPNYLKKAGSHARVGDRDLLPVSQQYFMEIYESCLQLNEWIAKQFHEKWHSSEYIANQTPKKPDNGGKAPPVEEPTN